MQTATLKRMPISSWSVEDRPTEKMIELGTSALTDAELLSIVIGSGTHKATAVDIAKHLLADHQNNLNELGKAEFNEICETEGIGTSTACRIMAAIELGKRRQIAQMGEHPDLSTACRVHQFMRPFCQDLKSEEAHLLLMNQNYRLIKHIKLSQGGITETLMDIRLIMKYAVINNATILTIVHNHPSENICPSRMDDEITRSIQNACKLMRIYFADHVIVCTENYYSYRENGKI
jgi:DNA repair protein RadC